MENNKALSMKSVFSALKKNAMLVVLVLVYIFFMITTGKYLQTRQFQSAH